MDLSWLDELPQEAREALLKEAERELSRTKLFSYYPETGPLRRELYPKHMEFFRAGATFRESCLDRKSVV